MNWMGIFQQFGRSLMLPMIALPAAAILLRLGTLPWEAIGLQQWGDIFLYAGHTIFAFLPYIFAAGVALGLTENSGTAGMASLVSYYMFTALTEYFTDTELNIGVTGSIVIGVLTAISYHRFKNIRFPEYIQFFGGPRFVPLFMAFVTMLLSFVFISISKPVEWLLDKGSEALIHLGGFGAFAYGVLHRLLVPTGLHHVLNNFFWFQVGDYQNENGLKVFGDLPRFFIGDPDAGIYMAGLYIVMMFALPAIAFAIMHEARDNMKRKVRSTFLVAALSSFLTGVSEPIEFAFLFVAPILFIVHALLSGLAMWIAYALDIHHGFAYSAGVIDFLINAHLGHNVWYIIPVGLIYGIFYYVLFRVCIRRFNIPTPGRENEMAGEKMGGPISYKAPLVIQALGGAYNIVHLEACITRLRITVTDERKLDAAALRQLGAAGIIRLGGGNIQVVFGTFAELLREEMVRLMRKDNMQVHFAAPVTGRMIGLDQVPDKVFSSKMVGEGIAFIPEKGELVSPVNAKVIHIHPAGHAIGLQTPEGLSVLLHIGIDSFGAGDEHKDVFQVKVREGDEVRPGTLLVRFDLHKLTKLSRSLATPMVVTNKNLVKSWFFAPYQTVKKGQSSVMSVVLHDREQTDGGDHHAD